MTAWISLGLFGALLAMSTAVAPRGTDHIDRIGRRTLIGMWLVWAVVLVVAIVTTYRGWR